MLRPRNTETYVDPEIVRIARVLKTHQPHDEQYAKTLEHLSKLHKMRHDELPDRASKDTMINAAANLVGMLMIVHHEHVGVITTKALAFVMRLK